MSGLVSIDQEIIGPIALGAVLGAVVIGAIGFLAAKATPEDPDDAPEAYVFVGIATGVIIGAIAGFMFSDNGQQTPGDVLQPQP